MWRHQAVFEKAKYRNTLLVSDETLGWTVGPNRSSEDGCCLTRCLWKWGKVRPE
jgi:hypothetical protein